MAAMTTAEEQGGGGTQAGALGQGALKTARTRNLGGSDAAIESSARQAGRQTSQGILGTQLANQRLKERQQAAGVGGLENLYSTNLGGSVGALGEVAQNVNANTNAQNASWDWSKYILDPLLQAGGQAGAAKLAAGG